MDKKFYMVFVEGENAPTKQHSDFIDAQKAAQRLSNKLGKTVFILETTACVTPREINECVDSFEAALMYLGRKDETNRLCISIYTKELLALYQLSTIAEAWNKADGFVADLSNENQEKWFPWFCDKDSAGLASASPNYTASSTYTHYGSRLCFKTENRARQFGILFLDLWKDLLIK